MIRTFAALTLALAIHPHTTPNPMKHLPPQVQATFACIAHAESRGKLVDTNPVTGTQGLYQFQVYLWQYARKFIPGLPLFPNQASRLQQDTVAAFFWVRNHGFKPEWQGECGV